MQVLKKYTNKFSGNKLKALKNIYWAVIGKVINIVSAMFVGILVARYLGPEQYGLMNYVISYVTLFNILATFGFDNIEIRELAKQDLPKEKILGTALTLRVCFSTATFMLVILTAYLFEADALTFWLIVIYSSSLLFGTLNVIRNYFISIVQNEYIVKTEITRTIFGGLVKIVLLLLKTSLCWFIIASAFDFLIISSGYIIAFKQKVDDLKKWSFSRSYAKHQLKESFPLLFSGAAIILYQKIDQVMIKNLIDSEAVGQYAVGARLSEFIVFIPMIIAQTITPMLVRTRKNNPINYEFKRQQFIDLMFWSTVVFSLMLSVLAKPAILLLYGAEYSAAIPVLQIMAWKASFSALFSSSGQIIVIEQKQKWAVIRNIYGAVFNIGMNFLLIPRIGIMGSAIISIGTMALTGYFSHLLIPTYNYLFKIQSRAIFTGPLRLISYLNKILE